MASIEPKLKFFIFISFCCLLINLSACCVALANTGEVITDDYTSSSNEEIGTIDKDREQQNVTASNFALATASSFLPFVDLISLVFLPLDPIVMLFVGLIVGLLGALKLILIISMIATFIPFINA